MLGYLISPVLQVENTDGKPLVGGRIVVYRHGTTEPYITYKDFEGTHNPAEVILDSKGMAILIAEEGYSYDVYCRDRNYVEQWSRIGISIGLGGTSIISRDGTITVKSAGGVVDLGISDNDVTVLTGTGAERGTDGNFSISKTASSGEGLEVTGNRVKVKKAGWYHIEATWYAQSNTTANGYRTVELSTRDSRTKLTLDLTVSSEQWRIIANDFYLHADEYIDFTLSGMGSDSAVRSWLQNVSIHRLTNIVGNPPDRVRPDWAEQDPDSPSYIFNKPNLAPVATTGSYEDLTDKPDLDIYATKVENATEGNLAALDAEGNLVDSGEAAANVVHDANYVHTDNNYTTADKDKLAGIEAGAEVNVQADWTEEDSSKDSYIQNKPNLAPVATTGDYEDLENKPHVPTVSGDGTSISSIDGLPIYAASATMATQDGTGNNIVDTYAKESAMSGKQDKLTAGTNISISNTGVIDVKNQNGYATNYSVALGNGCSAIGLWAFTHGYNALASGTYSYSHAEGSTTSAIGNNTHAEGNRTFANNDNAHAEGSGTSAANTIAHSEGFATIASGPISHAEGYSTSAVGARSHAEGEATQARGIGSNAAGYATSAVGNYSHAEGYNTRANGSYSHAEGSATSAIGNYSHTEGAASVTDGQFCHAEGYDNIATLFYSHAEGQHTIASGYVAHSEGNQTSAIFHAAHSEGNQTLAEHRYAHAEGQYTKTDTVGQHVEGQYNAPAIGALHVIGNGTATDNRSNIVETYTDLVKVNGNFIASGVNFINTVNELSQFAYHQISGTRLLIDRPTFNYNSNPVLSGMKVGSVYAGSTYYVTTNTYLQLSNCSAIREWGGNPIRVLFGRTNISEVPDYLPDGITNLYYFAGACGLSAIPTGWHISACPTVNTMENMFRNTTALRTDIKWFLDEVLDYKSNVKPSLVIAHAFSGCSAIPDYETLLTSETYSAFF